jgi:hypothetical protein
LPPINRSKIRPGGNSDVRATSWLIKCEIQSGEELVHATQPGGNWYVRATSQVIEYEQSVWSSEKLVYATRWPIEDTTTRWELRRSLHQVVDQKEIWWVRNPVG